MKSILAEIQLIGIQIWFHGKSEGQKSSRIFALLVDILPMKEYIKTAKALKADGNHKIINKQSCHFPKPLILDKMSSS